MTEKIKTRVIKITTDALEWCRKYELDAKKAAILDELIDRAATYCAIRASTQPVVGEECDHIASYAAREIAWGVIRSSSELITWAEAEARLRNGECWHLLIGGDQ